jgi:hypothetical protein
VVNSAGIMGSKGITVNSGKCLSKICVRTCFEKAYKSSVITLEVLLGSERSKADKRLRRCWQTWLTNVRMFSPHNQRA